MKRPFVDDMPAKSQIFDYWKERLAERGLFIDWGEPSCWVCGHHYGTKYDIKRSDAGWDKIFKCWDAIPLQRCHIIPRSLGGTNDCENLFLMCRECHDLAPNTSIPEVFFEWARVQSYYRRESTKILEAFKSFGLDETHHQDLVELLGQDEFRTWLSGKFGRHWPQSGYASTSSRITPATLIGLAAQYLRQTENSRKTKREAPRAKKSTAPA